MVAWYMRRRSVVATVALIATLALVGLPVPTGSRAISASRDLQPAAFTSVIVPADAPALSAWGDFGDALEPATTATADQPYAEPAVAPAAPVARPEADQPTAKAGESWKRPKHKVSGFASFYDNGTTAMRLPRGTVVRICGDGGCIQRTITDYGPTERGGRLIDMYRPDFFKICGCGSWSGTTRVTVSIY
jgi:hypothetical protein